MPTLIKKFKGSVLNEFGETYKDVRNQKCTIGLFFAILFVGIVIVGNAIGLIAMNFWLVTLTKELSAKNSAQIALLLVTVLFIEVVFVMMAIAFVAVFGAKEMWHALVDTNRMGSPLYRMLILIASGVLNAGSSILAVYAATRTPMFLQAIFYCTIPLSAQVWTLIFIPEERKRDYLSLFFVVSFILLIAGVLLPSASAFKEAGKDGAKGISFAWTSIHFLSCIVFGLWCVSQRLYLDALIDKGRKPEDALENSARGNQTADEAEGEPFDIFDDTVLLGEKRSWGRQNVRENSGKLVLLVGGMLFQIIFLLVIIPIDALPWFGTSSSVSDAGKGFSDSMRLIFKAWHNVRHGLLYSFGILLSFVGCTYLNEQSPTLGSVVLQMAGPFTSLVIMIFPQWNVVGDAAEPGYKIGGVIFLFIAAFLYHMWEQMSMRELIKRVHEAPREETKEVSAT